MALRIVRMTENTGYEQLVLGETPICFTCLGPIKGSFDFHDRAYSEDANDDWCACYCRMRIHTSCGCPLCHHYPEERPARQLTYD